MSNTHNGIYPRTLNALFNGNKISLNVARVICMANDYLGGSSWSGNRIEDLCRDSNKKKAKNAVNRAREFYKTYKNKSEYFVEVGRGKKMVVGCAVLKTPEEFIGTFNDCESDDFERVGTLIKVKNHWVVLEDLEEVEKLRREREKTNIQNGKTRIHFTDSAEDLASGDKYISHLIARDNKLGRMVTRGHGITF